MPRLVVPGGGGDHVRTGGPVQRGGKVVRVQPAVPGRHRDRGGQPQQPGRPRHAVVRLIRADQAHRGRRPLPRQQQRDEVRLGGAGGDHGVRGRTAGVRQVGDGGGHQPLELAGRGRLVPGVHRRVERACREVGGRGHRQRGPVQVRGAERIGRIGGAGGEGPDDGRQRRLGAGALLGQHGRAGGPHSPGDGVGTARRHRPATVPRSGRGGVQRHSGQPADEVGAVDTAGQAVGRIGRPAVGPCCARHDPGRSVGVADRSALSVPWSSSDVAEAGQTAASRAGRRGRGRAGSQA